MSKKNTVGGLIVSLVALLATVFFLVIGFITHIWNPTWLVFLLIPIVSIIIEIYTSRKDITGKITGIVALLCVIAFLLTGFFTNAWHPTWVIFFAIPISSTIMKILTSKNQDETPNQE